MMLIYAHAQELCISTGEPALKIWDRVSAQFP
jgi:hypothetical protein